jgi:leucyl-tRNA synthetase
MILAYAFERDNGGLVAVDLVEEREDGKFYEISTGKEVKRIISKMSKSLKNVVNPDDVVSEFGADTVRLYLCFMMPYEATAPWNKEAISGIFRFIKRVWELAENIEEGDLSSEELLEMNKAIKKVGDDLEMLQFNTAVSSLMIWLNFLTAKKTVKRREYENLLRLLAPFAPHVRRSSGS